MTNNQSSPETHSHQPGNYPNRVMLAVLAGMFATTFPITILSVSLGVLAQEFNTSETTISLVVSAPMLLSAVFLPILGKMGDLYGHRKVFLTGFAMATLASALITISWNATSLIGFRALAAIVGSATQPTAMALLCSVFFEEKRVKALGYWSMTTALAPALGLIIGGPVIDLIGWRMIFAIQAGLSVIVWIFGFVVLRETPKQDANLDVKGAMTLALAIGAMMFALMSARSEGLVFNIIPLVLGFAFAMLYLFIRIERQVEHPVLPLEFFQNRNFSFAIIANGFLGAGYMGALIMTPLFLMNELQYVVSAVAGIMLLRTLSLTIASPVGGQLGSAYGARRTAVLGSLVMTFGLTILLLGIYLASLPVIIGGLVLQGIGYGISMPPISATISNAVPDQHLGIASATNRLSAAVGGAFGISIASVVYGTMANENAFIAAFSCTALFSSTAFIATLFINRHAK